jgi:glycine/D-amino acid oxidase-like deaminating enzyme
MAHRDPLSRGAWKMAETSKAMWERQMATRSESSFGVACEWNRNGSLLVSTTFEESESLIHRVQLLQDAGIEAAYLDHRQLKQKEACLSGSSIQGGVLTPSDGQINGRKTAEALLSSCKSFGTKFEAIFHDGCNSALVDHRTGQPRIYGVELSSGLSIHATKGVVVACGAWTGGLLDTILGDINSDQTRPSWKDTILPSRGHLLVVRPDNKSPQLRHGVMESTYTKHYDRNADTPSQEIDITFTATRNHIDGTVLLGSSREVGQPLQHHQHTRADNDLKESIKWDNTPDDGIVRRILERAYDFVPTIFGDSTITDIANDIVGQQGRHAARVGLRPYAFGRPLVGPIPEAAGLYVAAGHEGSGLTLGPITAEIVLHHISNTNDIDLEDILSYLSMNP